MAYYSSPSELFSALRNVFSGAPKNAWDYVTQPQNALGLLAGAGTVAGGVGQYMGAQQAADRSREMTRLANRPIDVNQFYAPLTEAARQAYARQLQADMATQGTPMQGAYAQNMTAEGLARFEAERYAEAMRQAGNARQMQLYGMANRPGLPALGDVGAMGSYLRWRAAQAARERGVQQPPGAADTRNLGMPDVPQMGVNQDFTQQAPWAGQPTYPTELGQIAGGGYMQQPMSYPSSLGQYAGSGGGGSGFKAASLYPQDAMENYY